MVLALLTSGSHGLVLLSLPGPATPKSVRQRFPEEHPASHEHAPRPLQEHSKTLRQPQNNPVDDLTPHSKNSKALQGPKAVLMRQAKSNTTKRKSR